MEKTLHKEYQKQQMTRADNFPWFMNIL
jgi:hypothetical protein